MHYLVIETPIATGPAKRHTANPPVLPPGLFSAGTWMDSTHPRRIHLLKTHNPKLLNSWLSSQATGVKFAIVRIHNINQVRKVIGRLIDSDNKATPRQDQDPTNAKCLPVNIIKQKLAPDDIVK